MPLSVQDKIDIGGLSSLYASNDLASGKTYGGAQDKRLPFLIWVFTEGIILMQEYSYPTEDTDKVGNYLLSICRDQLKAEAVLELNNGGTVAPITGGGSVPNPYDFEVSSTSTPLANGESLVTITLFIGFNVIFFRNNIPQSTINNGGSYFSWNRLTGQFQCFPAAATSEIFTIMPVG